MILPRWRAEYAMYITPHVRGDFVELKDVIKMLEDAKNMDICGAPLTIEYQTLWDAGIDQLINELKKEPK
jgi:hypothetical protein